MSHVQAELQRRKLNAAANLIVFSDRIREMEYPQVAAPQARIRRLFRQALREAQAAGFRLTEISELTRWSIGALEAELDG